MSYLLTNQNNFGHIPYPSPSHPNATVKSGGCGPCAALMIVENLTPSRYKMKEWIAWVISTGARVSGGTAMKTLAGAMAAKFGFGLNTTNSEAELAAHLKAGGMAIANVGGAYGDWRGLFSTSGHFVTVLGVAGDGKLIVGDPDFRDGKYSAGTLGKWRSQYVTVKSGLVYVKPDILHRDTVNRSPNYYLFAAPATVQNQNESEGEEMAKYEKIEDVPKWSKETMQKMIARDVHRGNGKDLGLTDEKIAALSYIDRALTWLVNNGGKW